MRMVRGLAFLACLAAWGCSPVERTDCNDGIDNDGDGQIDSNDPGCAYNNNNVEAPDPAKPACSDGADNDVDGVTDFPSDPGCVDANDNDETDPPPPPPQCNDGLDNDNNGRIDYPFDAACGSATDNAEDGNPATTQCSDGVDNDGDTKLDYPGDPGCAFAGDDDEYNAIIGECGPGIDVQPFPTSVGYAEGDRSAASSNELTGACGGLGGEFVWTYQVTQTSSLIVSTQHASTTLDTVVYVRSVCRNPATELGCGDDVSTTVKASQAVIPRVEPGTYYIIVDAFGPGSLGHFRLTVETRLAQGEPCDPVVADQCAPGLICRELTPGAATTCEYHECGDELDNDGDTTVDYPDEAGCTSVTDDTELIPTGDPIPACGDGTDNDGDELIDFPSDLGCSCAADTVEIDECAPGSEVAELIATGTTGTTAGAPSLFSSTCDSSSSSAEERVFGFRTSWNLVSLWFEAAATGTSFYPGLYVRTGDCATGTQVACAAYDYDQASQRVTISSPTADTDYFVFVDGDYDPGPFLLTAGGSIAGGSACPDGDTQFLCEAGYVCEASLCVPSQCNDDLDNDGDTLIDYPVEPGCRDLSDDDEVDPVPAPVCADGADNDGDTLTDYPADLGCTCAADGVEINECVTGLPVNELLTSVTGSIVSTGTSRAAETLCTSTYGTESSEEDVYVFQVDRTYVSLTFATTATTSFDAVLYVRSGVCATGAELACVDGSSGAESLTLTAPALGDLYVFVDSDYSATGTYELGVTGLLPLGAACDLGSARFTCAPGTTCDNATFVCVPTLCNDDSDNDGDTLADEMDPGCASIIDNDEADPATLPECSDDVDNDGDTLVDYPADTGCDRAGDNMELNCTDSDPVIDVTYMQTYVGTTTGKTDNFDASCGSSSATAPDVVHVFSFPGMLSTVTFDTNDSLFDTTLSIVSGMCSGTALECDDDDGSPGTQSLITRTSLAAGTYFLIVDGYSAGSGSYNLHITGTIAAGELCDPLQVTTGFLSCPVGMTCNDKGTGLRCQTP